MKKYLLLHLIFAMVLLYSNRAFAETEVRNVPSFSAVSFNIAGTVYLEQGSPQGVRVETGETTLKELITEVKDGTLIIRMKNNNFFMRPFRPDKISIYVTVPEINALTVTGSGSIECKNLNARELTMVVTGSGNLSINNLITESAKATITGSGNIHLNNGRSAGLVASISGSGNIRAIEFDTGNADIKISGSGDCTLTASQTLKARISGSGSITYDGSPQLDSSVSGSGRKKKL